MAYKEAADNKGESIIRAPLMFGGCGIPGGEMAVDPCHNVLGIGFGILIPLT